MTNRLSKFIGAVLILVFFGCLFYFWNKGSQIPFMQAKSPFVKASNIDALSSQSDFTCMNATVHRFTFPMCIYDPQSDIYVSKLIFEGNYFESDLVTKTINFLNAHRNVTFLDLGANLGTYSLPVAHSGIHVLAVEANSDTVRRLAKAIDLGKIRDKIDLFHYAVGSERSTTFLKFDSKNRGDTYTVGNITCPGCLLVTVTTLDYLIPFVRNKKVYIKVDIQEGEIKAFTREAAGKFFSEFDILMIQMEWVLYPERYGKDEKGRRQVDHFLEFFYQRGYDVYDPRSEKKLGSDWTKWSYDVMFKRSDLNKKKLFQI